MSPSTLSALDECRDPMPLGLTDPILVSGIFLGTDHIGTHLCTGAKQGSVKSPEYS
jgi:hypothetical protein